MESKLLIVLIVFDTATEIVERVIGVNELLVQIPVVVLVTFKKPLDATGATDNGVTITGVAVTGVTVIAVDRVTVPMVTVVEVVAVMSVPTESGATIEAVALSDTGTTEATVTDVVELAIEATVAEMVELMIGTGATAETLVRVETGVETMVSVDSVENGATERGAMVSEPPSEPETIATVTVAVS